MKYIADLHIHSHFSRATSKALNPENLSLWAQKKGVTVIGTGDFTHPGWMSELQEKLVEAEEGLYKLRPDLQKKVDSQVPYSCLAPSRFLLSGEISCIYKKNGKVRKVHNLVLMPDLASVIRLNERLGRIGNISSDGRPILGLDSRDLLEITLEASEMSFFIPAHIWTPWFSVFGSKSGFNTLEECFEDLTGYIHALETGLSSDPPMNRLISFLDNYLLVSNSDAHSPSKLGREANLFDTKLDYTHMIQAMIKGHGFIGTIEFFPEEGKYHMDGHRKCGIRLLPAETDKYQGICPVCKKSLTVGVLNRIRELSDRDAPRLSKDFFSLIPLPEVLSELLSCGAATKKVMFLYERLLSELGAELKILLDVPVIDIETVGGPVLAEAIDRMRRGQVIFEAGFDGEYGIIRLFQESEKQTTAGQMALFEKEMVKSSRQPDSAPHKSKVKERKREMRAQDPVSLIDPILDPLNPEQRLAVLYQGGHLLVVAGPGTGKTMTLTHRIAQLIREGIAAPEHILALTFTRKTAREMGHRIASLLKGSARKQVWVATFHGFCLEILRKDGHRIGLPPDFAVCSEWDAKNIAQEILVEYGAGKRSIREFLKNLSVMKIASVLGLEEDVCGREFSPLFDKYQHRLKNLGMIDLDDMEVMTLSLLRNHPVVLRRYAEKLSWIFVDEYQDTNLIQVELLKTLINGERGNICAIGDPDQAIYGFRGADVENFYRFTEDFPGAKEIVLKRNYRSTKFILKGSGAIMGKAEPLQCESSGGVPISIAPCQTESEEAEMIVEQIERLIGGTSYFSLDSGRVASHEGEESVGFGDIGILYRLNAQGDALKKAMDRAGIPVVRSGESPLVGRYPVNILWRFLQTIQYPDNAYYRKIYEAFFADGTARRKEAIDEFHAEIPLSEIIDQAVTLHELECSSEESVEALLRLKHLAVDFKGDTGVFLDALSLERGIDHTVLVGDRVALMSIHAAKGLEWSIVFITGCEDKLIPCSLFGNRDEKEERRLFYVGMTRARSQLILSHVNRRALNRRVIHMSPSPFLDEIPKDLLSSLERSWKPRKRAHKQLKLF